ncbi:unnamed protein product [Linum trigynum]|uniref:Uncharacterized protein n=1 Tax=Linum trigynum TaxID=586398 RepID=A0AAV2GU89_9ROSI
MYCSVLSNLSFSVFSPAAAFGAFNVQRVDKPISCKEIKIDRRGQKGVKKIKEDPGSIYGRSKSRAGLSPTDDIKGKWRRARSMPCLGKSGQLQLKPPDQLPSNEYGGGRRSLAALGRKRVKKERGEENLKGHKQEVQQKGDPDIKDIQRAHLKKIWERDMTIITTTLTYTLTTRHESQKIEKERVDTQRTRTEHLDRRLGIATTKKRKLPEKSSLYHKGKLRGKQKRPQEEGGDNQLPHLLPKAGKGFAEQEGQVDWHYKKIKQHAESTQFNHKTSKSKPKLQKSPRWIPKTTVPTHPLAHPLPQKWN